MPTRRSLFQPQACASTVHSLMPQLKDLTEGDEIVRSLLLFFPRFPVTFYSSGGAVGPVIRSVGCGIST